MTENYYAILNVDEDATYEEIKDSYKTLVKQHHPDKQEHSDNNESSTSAVHSATDVFRKIDEAWKVLRDVVSRREYDAKQMNATTDNILVYRSLNLSDLKYDSDNNMHYYECRCGGDYIVHPAFFEENECIVSCDQCSLVIKVKK